MQEAKRQGPRGLNRHRYTLEEAEKALQKPAVQALMKMITFRNKHKAFEGQVSQGCASPHPYYSAQTQHIITSCPGWFSSSETCASC